MLSLVLVRSLVTTAAGVILGIAASVATTSYLEALLFGVVPLDQPTFIGVACLLAVVAATAASIPGSRRATRIRSARRIAVGVKGRPSGLWLGFRGGDSHG